MKCAVKQLKFLLIVLIIGFLPGCDWLGGAFENEPEDIDNLSPEAKAHVAKAYEGIDASKLTDYHTHMFGLNPKTYGTFVNEGWQNPFNIPGYAKFLIYKSAGGITDLDKVDEQYIDRLIRLIEHLPKRGKFGLMAFDYFHDEQGNPDRGVCTFHVPNQRMMDVVAEYPDYFFPIISVHPYRDDAISELKRYVSKGVRFIKWLPNAMGINPASEKPHLKQKLEAYYRTMVEHDMVLITHTGDEKATEAEDFQRYGNPLYLKKPLSMGVKIIMSHVASLGVCSREDKTICKPGTEYIDLAMDMLRDKQYDEQLYADISAVTQFNRKGHLDKILASTDLHDKFVNGSDYPLPAVNFVIQTRALAKSGHITDRERELLNEIYDVNPLLFDFVLKRTIKHTVTNIYLPGSIFSDAL